MFKYNKKIDAWSRSMILEVNEAWGLIIDKDEEKISLKMLKYLLDYLDGYMKVNGNKIFLIFSRILDMKCHESEVRFYVNSSTVSLHNGSKKFVSISCRHGFDVYPTVIIHEIFHILFYQYINFNKNAIKEKISEYECNEIKEILTVLINLEFQNLIYKHDKGYPVHATMRNEVEKFWKKKKSFGALLGFVLKEFRRNNHI